MAKKSTEGMEKMEFPEAKTQMEEVEMHLNQFGSITSWHAFSRYGITRLSSYILRLRKKDWNIETENVTEFNRYGHRTTFAKYHLKDGGEPQ
jgi:hypothetical protein